MRRILALSCLAAFSCVGCAEVAPPAAAPLVNTPASTPEPPAAAEEAPVTGMLVSLKLPNMVCDGCAKAVKKDLVALAGIANIKTDPEHNICTFVVTDAELDWKAKLAELAEENSHLADWSVAEGG